MSRFVGNAITVGRRLRSQIVTNVVCLAALIASCFIFVPAHGVTGAAAAVAITSLLRLVFNTRILFGFLAEWDAETQPRSASQSIGEGSIA
jgi:O-antigen/teichoic acid export membrane protein